MRTYNRAYLLCVLMSLLLCTLADAQEEFAQSPCDGKSTCKECIQTKGCAWCLREDFGDKPRCFQPSYGDDPCGLEFEYNPHNMQSIVANMPVTRIHRLDEEEKAREIVQLSPQRVNLKLRMYEANRIHVRYAQAENFPVDVYYLTDTSNSMTDHKEILHNLGKMLAESMANITDKFQLGFGSFVNEVLMPNDNANTEEASNYGYKHLMDLSADSHRFYEVIKNSPISKNLDAPQGGLDALLQALVCKQQIGWRENSRRIIIYSTNAGFHHAEDGKLGRNTKPNDGLCHIDNRGSYTYSAIQNFPSISQINEKVREQAIHIIFVVTPEQTDAYRKLSRHIEGSSVATLGGYLPNVLSLIEELYWHISSSIELKDNATTSVNVYYESACFSEGPMVETNKCSGLKFGDIVSFSAEITVISCPENPKDWFQTIEIYPVGISESIIINLEMICGCPCEQESHPLYEKLSPKCHANGNYMCGTCDCEKDFFGKRCECFSSEPSPPSCGGNNATSIDCNGRGQCICGFCECEKRSNPEELIFGNFCECDNFSCDLRNQLLCSGPDHGTCECGACICKPGWTGSACDCRATNDTCVAPDGEEICSGHGECECGTCKCKVTDEGRYTGKYCQKCPTCAGRCHELKDCVQCRMYETGPLAKKNACSSNCTTFVPIGVETLYCDQEKGASLCTYYDEDDCKYQFCYNEDKENKLEVHAKQERKCPPESSN